MATDEPMNHPGVTDDDLLESVEPESAAATVMVVDHQARIRRAFASRLDGHGIESVEAESGQVVFDCLEDHDVDLILLDIEMPEMDGFEVLESLREDFELSELPIIMLTGREEEKDILRALELGANDYVTKDTDFQIALARIKTQLRLKFAMDRILEVARTDELTGLMNRRAFYERLEQEHQRFDRTKKPYSLVMMDIDHFKKVNDTHGHAAGDRVLQEFSGRLSTAIRGIDVLCRFGGEEFILLLPETDYDGALTVAEKLREAVADEPFSLDDARETITASFGVTAQEPDDSLSTQELIKRADQAMYTAKNEGRNCVRGNRATAI